MKNYLDSLSSYLIKDSVFFNNKSRGQGAGEINTMFSKICIDLYAGDLQYIGHVLECKRNIYSDELF